MSKFLTEMYNDNFCTPQEKSKSLIESWDDADYDKRKWILDYLGESIYDNVKSTFKQLSPRLRTDVNNLIVDLKENFKGKLLIEDDYYNDNPYTVQTNTKSDVDDIEYGDEEYADTIGNVQDIDRSNAQTIPDEEIEVYDDNDEDYDDDNDEDYDVLDSSEYIEDIDIDSEIESYNNEYENMHDNEDIIDDSEYLEDEESHDMGKEPQDWLKSDFRSVDGSGDEDDAEWVFNELKNAYPERDASELRQIADDWVGVDYDDEDIEDDEELGG